MIVRAHDVDCVFGEILPRCLHVSPDVAPTKNWSQDIWMMRYLGTIFDCRGVTPMKAC
jgi:hypothetical protein